MIIQSNSQQRQAPSNAPAYNLKLPWAAFSLIVICGLILAIIIAANVSIVVAAYVFGAGVVVAIVVALGIILSDRADFRHMNRAEQRHAHEMQRMATETERMRVIKEVNEQLLEAQRQLAPVPMAQLDHPGRAIPYNGGKEMIVMEWNWPLADGRMARGDLIEGIVLISENGWRGSVREGLRKEAGLKFDNGEDSLAWKALIQEQVIDGENKTWITTPDETRAVVARMKRKAAALPQKVI
jgi:uncharacterized integral membrane protein